MRILLNGQSKSRNTIFGNKNFSRHHLLDVRKLSFSPYTSYSLNFGFSWIAKWILSKVFQEFVLLLKYDFLFIALIFQTITTLWAFKRIWYSWYCWKAMAKWNTEMENILEKRRTEVEKNEDKNVQPFYKIAANSKFWSQKLKFFLIMKMKFWFWFKVFSEGVRERESSTVCKNYLVFLKFNVF